MGAVVDYLLRWSIMIKLTHCRLRKNVQIRLLEFFVLEVTARSAADFLGLQPNTAALFYRKIRQVIVHHLEIEAEEMFEGRIEVIDKLFWQSSQRKKRRWSGGEDCCSWYPPKTG